MLHARDELVNGPLSASVVAEQGRSAALLLVVIGVAVGSRATPRRARAARPDASARTPGKVAVGLAVAAAAALLVAADPATRFDEFRQPPRFSSAPTPGFVQSHVLSARGNGRWQFWGASIDQGIEHPLVGDGAGSFAAWWAEHRDIPVFVRDAHSLYLETFAELGLVGLLLVLAFLGSALVEGVRRARHACAATRTRSRPRSPRSVLAFAFAAGDRLGLGDLRGAVPRRRSRSAS